jgi:hypothetical protein
VSRLDSFIRRLEAQRACLDWAVAATHGLPGPAVELGLGNGRTFDHLRARIDGRRPIFALDRRLAAHPACVPDAAHLILGDFRDTLPALVQRLRGTVAFVHADTGSGDETASRAQAESLAAPIDALLALGGVVASDQDMGGAVAGWAAVDLPPGIAAGRYFLYRKA